MAEFINKSRMMDENRLRRGLLTLILIAVSVFLARYGLRRNAPVFGLFIPLVGIISWLLGRPALLFALVLAVERSGLAIPGLPNALGIPKLFQLLLFGWMLLDLSVRHNRPRYSFKMGTDGWMLIFLMNLTGIMLIRGSGFALLGSSVFGGTYYIGLIIALACYFAAIRVRLSDQDVKVLIILLLTGTAIPATVQTLNYLSPALFGWLMRFVRVAVVEQADSINTETVIQRWSGLTSIGYVLIMISYVSCKSLFKRWILIAFALFMILLSGFRSAIFQAAVLVFFASFYYSKQRTQVLFYWCIAGIIGYLGLFMISPVLPLPIQRAVSFIPFLPLSPEVLLNAQSSNDFRFDLWKQYCIPNIPKYLLIGRGLAQDITAYAWLQAKWYGSLEFFYYMGSYHSGPFSLLLDHGLVGTIAFTAFFWLVAADAWQTTKTYASKIQTLAARYYVYLTILMTYEIFNYYFIFGAVLSSLFRMLMIAAQLRILKKNFLMAGPLEGGVQTPDQPVEAVKPKGRPFPVKSENRWRRPGAAKR